MLQLTRLKINNFTGLSNTYTTNCSHMC